MGETLYEGLADYYAEFIEEFRQVKLPPIGSVGPLAGGAKYFVREEGEGGWTQTCGGDGYLINATSGNDSTGKTGNNNPDNHSHPSSNRER